MVLVWLLDRKLALRKAETLHARTAAVRYRLERAGRAGFTMLEVIALLVVLGIVAAVAVSRGSNIQADLQGQTEAIKTHIRYAQRRALNSDVVWGIKCDGAAYWLFRGENPDDSAAKTALPGESGTTISLTAKKVSLPAFTVFFNEYGQPFSVYQASGTQTPWPGAGAAMFSVGSVPSGSSKSITITPETGFVP